MTIGTRLMTRSRSSVVLVLGIVVAVVVAIALVVQITGLTASGQAQTLPLDPPPAVAPVTTNATPTPSPTPSPTPTLAPVQTEINAAVVKYYRVTDELEQSPPRDPYKKLWTITKDEAFLMWQDTLLEENRNGWHATGWTKLLSIKVSKKLSATEYRVNVCGDVSGTDVLNKHGKSIVLKGRPLHPSATLEVKKIDGAWYVVQDRDGTQKC